MPRIDLTSPKVAAIRKLLEEHPQYRDNDLKLLAHVWMLDLKESKQLTKERLDFLTLVANGHLTHFESVRRYRQEIQAQVPELSSSNSARKKPVPKLKSLDELPYDS